MYIPYTINEINKLNEETFEFTVMPNEIRFCFISTKSGRIFRKMKSGKWKEIINKSNHTKGYNVILIDKKQYMRSKLILYSLNKINLNDKNLQIMHKNKNKLDCNMDNLYIKNKL